jgi:long-chain fatty acid transport protein
MARRTLAGWAGILATLTLGGVARANPEPMSVYDARSVGMGGVGVADNDSIAAAVLNPANFDLIKKFTATLDFTGLSPKFTAPLPGPTGPVPTTTETKVTPLFLAGAAYRVCDPLVIGLAAYIAEGSGGAYSNDFKFTFGQVEVSLPISYRIIEGLSVGVQPRFGYALADVTLPAQGPMAPATSGSLNGTGWGVSAGLNWRPMEDLKLGFSYRSKMSMTLKGDATYTPPGAAFPTTISFATPDTFRLGAAWTVLKALTIAPELRYALFSGSNKSRTTTTTTPMGVQTTVTPQDWMNAWTAALGLEYRFLGILAVRAGGSVGNSATPASTMSPFDVPPGTIGSIGGGVGVQVIDTLQIDAGIFDQFGSGTVACTSTPMTPCTASESSNGAPGTYSLNAVFFALSATLRI